MKVWIVKAFERVYCEGEPDEVIVKVFYNKGKADAWEKSMWRDPSISYIQSAEEVEVE